MSRGAVWFYSVFGTILGLAIFAAVVFSLGSIEADTSNYPQMSDSERAAEYKALKDVKDHPQFTWMFIAKTETRFERLRLAMIRAKKEHPIYDHNVDLSAWDEVSLDFLRQQYMEGNKEFLSDYSPDIHARMLASAGYPDNGIRGFTHASPWTPWLWLGAYCSMFFFALGHFRIKMKDIGGRPWLMVSDWRFWVWLAACPVGVFRYPKPVDVVGQVKRAYRFITFLFSSILTMGVAACAGKPVNTNPEQRRRNAPWALHVDAATSTLPYYLGADGGVFHPAPVQQSLVTVSAPSGVYTGVWNSLPLGGLNLNPNYGYEVDLFGGWGGKVHGFNLNQDVNYTAVVPLSKETGDVWLFTTDLGRSFKFGHGMTVTPQFRYRLAVPAVGESPPGGRFFRESLAWGWQHGRLSLSARAGLLHDSGAFGFNPGWLTDNALSVSVGIGKSARLELPIRITRPLSPLGDGRSLQVQTGLTVSWHH